MKTNNTYMSLTYRQYRFDLIDPNDAHDEPNIESNIGEFIAGYLRKSRSCDKLLDLDTLLDSLFIND